MTTYKFEHGGRPTDNCVGGNRFDGDVLEQVGDEADFPPPVDGLFNNRTVIRRGKTKKTEEKKEADNYGDNRCHLLPQGRMI